MNCQFDSSDWVFASKFYRRSQLGHIFTSNSIDKFFEMQRTNSKEIFRYLIELRRDIRTQLHPQLNHLKHVLLLNLKKQKLQQCMNEFYEEKKCDKIFEQKIK